MLAVTSTESVELEKLRPYPKNPRRGNVEAIAMSLKAHGQFRALVVNSRTQEVLAGNHTFLALRQIGASEALVHYVDVDDEEAARIVLVDNRANDFAEYDDAALLELLQSLPDTSGTGYDDSFLADLVTHLEPQSPGRDTEPQALPEEPVSRPGDVWILGEHRLMCGNATSATDVAKLIGSKRCQIMWTDPPYGVSYVGKTKDGLTIENDGADGLEDLLSGAFAVATTALDPGSPVYIAHPPGALSITFGRCFLDAGWRLHETLVWVKDSMVLGRSDYHYKHEPILYGYTAGGEGRRGRGGTCWYGDNSQVSVFEVARPKRSREHPTMKPVELVERMLINSSSAGDLVYEPFGGSGTTLIACENLNRKCRLFELDPAYCDVIVNRWERHTLKKAVREAATDD